VKSTGFSFIIGATLSSPGVYNNSTSIRNWIKEVVKQQSSNKYAAGINY